MRIVKPGRVREYWKKHARAKPSLEAWLALTRAAKWENIHDLRHTFPNADPVKVESGRTVTVFNIAGNAFRLITAIHYNRGIVYVLRLLTHAEYDKDAWKRSL